MFPDTYTDLRKKLPKNARFSSSVLTVSSVARYVTVLVSRIASSKGLLPGGPVGKGRVSPRSETSVIAEDNKLVNCVIW
jgi:hypothetical protein